ncbi:hypothetical protein E8E13_010813 [Curvularia kusanoi]|uniref:Uncharacterized protein n=1 Tax=Curvularia kusanoi TaxID=90978 RepID=A0A9P4THU0_CURKU|nr:hypothetical protein E8E13_010813 [Curvularia kusanoi]
MQARSSPVVHAVRWPEVFVKERKVDDPQFFKSLGAILEHEISDHEKEKIDMAFVNFDSSIPSWEVHVIRRFFKAAESMTFSTPRKSARAMLDDRDYETGQARSYARWLDARDLHEALSAERFDSITHPKTNADRRLIYIYGLSPEYIISLVKSASNLQISALRDTICKHVAFETSIRIHIPHETSRWMLYEANVSVVISGWDHHQWVGWAFSNTLSDPTCEDEDEEEAEVNEDYFATDGNGPDDGRIVIADSPIWDPREYWLHIVNIRMVIIHKEWSWLIMNVARRIETREPDLKLAIESESPEAQQQVSVWLTLTKRLLRRLDEKFSTTMHIWSNFSASGGHIEYLSEMPGTNLQLFVITTPLVLALQYFGADKDIFSFERNAKTFGIAICVLFSVLSVLAYVLNLLNHGRRELYRKLRLEREEMVI